ncbi:MAG: 6-bladed beta-propeller [Nitrospirota bacterium]
MSTILRHVLCSLVLSCFFALIAGGCTVKQLQPDSSSALSGQDTNLVWPSPPETPRIRYLGSISAFRASKGKQTWFSRTLGSLFGEEKEEGYLLRPYGIFVDSNRIYVTDPGLQTLHVFDNTGQQYLQIRGAGDQRFLSPIGVSVDSNGDIYLSDSALRKVFVFNREGSLIREIGSPEILMRPSGIVLADDKVYVVDTHGHNVSVFSKKDGNLLFRFGQDGTAPGDFHFPTNIFHAGDGLLYITDSMNFRVQVFDRSGTVQTAFGKPGDGAGDFSKPKGIAVDSEGHIYVADAHFDAVQIFDRNGRLLLAFGSSGSGNGQMILPAGLFIDPEDRIYVTDSYNKRIQVFQYLGEAGNRIEE